MLQPLTCCGSMSGHTSICYLVSDRARKPFRITYPERRVVSDEQMCVWYADAVANGELEDMGPVSAYMAAKALHEAGLITLELS